MDIRFHLLVPESGHNDLELRHRKQPFIGPIVLQTGQFMYAHSDGQPKSDLEFTRDQFGPSRGTTAGRILIRMTDDEFDHVNRVKQAKPVDWSLRHSCSNTGTNNCGISFPSMDNRVKN